MFYSVPVCTPDETVGITSGLGIVPRKAGFHAETKLNLPTRRISGIQMLRGVAAMLVVFHHFSIMTKGFGAPNALLRFRFVAELGASGVDIFFCVSGFVMMVAVTSELNLSQFRGRDFMVRRFIRIYPLYWIVTAAFIPVLLVGNMEAVDLSHAAHPQLFSPLYLLRTVLLLPTHWPGAKTIAPLLFPGWTLSYEFYFYGLIALTATVLHNPRDIVFALAAEIGTFFVLARVLPATGTTLQEFLANPVACEFVMGAGVFLLARRKWKYHQLYILAGVLGLLVTIFIPALSGRRALLWGVPAAFITFGIVAGDHATPRQRFFLLVGNSSFSIYLVHILVVYLYVDLLRRGLFPDASSQDVAIAIGFICAVQIGLWVHIWAEKPITDWLNRKYRMRFPLSMPRAIDEQASW